jgi:hypothetical protein
MLELRIGRLTLLTVLAFCAVLRVFSAPLNSQTSQNLTKAIPDLRGYDGETRRTMEIACISEKMKGPVADGECLIQQVASLKRSPGIPDLSGYDGETRRTMEIACISKKMQAICGLRSVPEPASRFAAEI